MSNSELQLQESQLARVREALETASVLFAQIKTDNHDHVIPTKPLAKG